VQKTVGKNSIDFGQDGIMHILFIFRRSARPSRVTIVRTVVLFVPLGWVFAHFGLNAFWLTYPLTEIITTITGYVLYRKQFRQMKPAKLG